MGYWGNRQNWKTRYVDREPICQPTAENLKFAVMVSGVDVRALLNPTPSQVAFDLLDKVEIHDTANDALLAMERLRLEITTIKEA